MNAEERRRAGRAIQERMNELGLSIRELAEKAGLDRSTIRAAINGTTWPRPETRRRISEALGWQFGDVARRALGYVTLETATQEELLDELCRRRRRAS